MSHGHKHHEAVKGHEQLGINAYDAYRFTVGAKDEHGYPLPRWESLSELTKRAWMNAAQAVVKQVQGVAELSRFIKPTADGFIAENPEYPIRQLMSMPDLEWYAVMLALAQTNGNRRRACKVLGVSQIFIKNRLAWKRETHPHI